MPDPTAFTDSVLNGPILDALDCGAIVVDGAVAVVLWNDWIATTSRIAADDAVGRRLDAIFPGAPLRRLEAAVTQALQSGASSLLTHALHPRLLPLSTRTGRPLIQEVAIRPIGVRPYTSCLIQIFDVTVAVERERVLRAGQNARYAAVVDNARDAILTIDAAGTIQFANPAAQRVLGFAPDALLGCPAAGLFADEVAWLAAWRATLGGAMQHSGLELLGSRADGSPTYLEVSLYRWNAEERLFVGAILRDVNERHATQTALRRLNETLEERVAIALAERKLLADIVESTDTMIQVVDADFRLLAVNAASADEYERLYGVRPHVGANLSMLLAAQPTERAKLEGLWRRALAGEMFSTIEDLGDPARERRSYELKFDALRDQSGVQFAAFQIVHDVTDRLEEQAQLLQTEEALRQSQKMEAIGQLTGGIAHDFNNLLTGIIGAIDIVKRRLAAGRHEDIGRFMDAATVSANRAASLTHRLLAFARRQPLDPKATDVNQVLRGVEDLLRRTLGERIKLSLMLDPELWPTLTDANQLENSVINLAINARDAMSEGGLLTLETERVTLTAPLRFPTYRIEPGEYAVIRVSDTGIGIDPEALPKVFEPFFTTKPMGQGTGLGLSMIYGFVKQTGGNIRIESTLGEGTEVSLYLRRYHGAAEMESKASLAAPRGAGETVLLVEDDSSVRLLIGEVLRDLGYGCIEADDGPAALPILTSNTRLDLMITDIGLPGLNGQELARIARRHRPDLRILFVTGYAEHATGDTPLAPDTAMVTKPFTLDALAFRIRDMLSR